MPLSGVNIGVSGANIVDVSEGWSDGVALVAPFVARTTTDEAGSFAFYVDQFSFNLIAEKQDFVTAKIGLTFFHN